MQKVLLIGGSGKQSGAVYLPILLDPNKIDIQLVAIADPADPLVSRFSKIFEKELHTEGTHWISLKGNMQEDLKMLDEFIQDVPCDTLAISCPPLYHMAYVEWGLKQGLDIIVDKPVVCRLNQFGNTKAAKGLRSDYSSICFTRETSKHRTKKRPCMISVPLMRRVTDPYTKILKDLREVYSLTGQNLTHMYACRSDGCFRFADEYDRPGAHGFREGLGTLTMSGYHYIDFIAACLMSAPVKGTILEAKLNNKVTVGDVRRINQHLPFGRFLDRPKDSEESKFKGDNAELDFSVSYTIREPKAALPDCELSFTFIQRGSTRRVSPTYSKEITHDEGLTNDCVMVIHQGPFQSFHCLVSQDPTTGGRITLIRRLNPKLADKLNIQPLTIKDFDLRTNENVLNNRQIITNLLDSFAGKKHSGIYEQIDVKKQRLTMELYAGAIGASAGPYKVILDKNFWQK